ncbi:MAG: glycosyltransferase family 39 protein [Methanobrevibacter sp.]|jgi:hypothetical protein|nr:glycosyltransferase family 39 protein [Candidatus Methanovirga meridionalis]
MFKKSLGVFLSVFSIVLLIILLVSGVNQAFFSQDEEFTFHLVSYSFEEIILATAADVHPPLYYFLLKLFLMCFSSSLSVSIILAKVFSVIPLILLICFSFIKIRKDFDWLTVGIFLFSLVSMSKILYYFTQIRMYSYVMFFMFLSFYYCCEIIKKPNKKNWIIFTVFGLLAAYTHYYGVIAVGFLFLFLFIHIVRGNWEFFKSWVLSFIATLLVYCPWIYFFSSSKYFYGSELGVPSFTVVFGIVGFMFSPITDVLNHNSLNIYGLILFIVVLVFLMVILFKRKRIMAVDYGFALFVGVLFFGLIFSVLVKPIFNERYLLLVLVCFWFSFSVLLSRSYSKKKIFIPVLIVLIFVGFVNSLYFVDCKNYEFMTDLQFKNSISNLTVNDTIVYLGPGFMVGKFKTSFHLMENDFIIWNNNINVSDLKERLNDNQVYVFDCGDLKNTNLVIDEFNRTIIENGLRLNSLGEINRCYPAYPRHVYALVA